MDNLKNMLAMEREEFKQIYKKIKNTNEELLNENKELQNEIFKLKKYIDFLTSNNQIMDELIL